MGIFGGQKSIMKSKILTLVFIKKSEKLGPWTFLFFLGVSNFWNLAKIDPNYFCLYFTYIFHIPHRGSQISKISNFCLRFELFYDLLVDKALNNSNIVLVSCVAYPIFPQSDQERNYFVKNSIKK